MSIFSKLKSIPILNSTVQFLLRYFSKGQLVLLVILILVLFVFNDDRSIFVRIQNARTILQLEKEIEQCNKEIETYQTMIEELSSNNDNLEKFAREQLHMRAPNEDVFVID